MQARTFSLSTVKVDSIATESITGRSTRLGEPSVLPAISRVPLARARQMARDFQNTGERANEFSPSF